MNAAIIGTEVNDVPVMALTFEYEVGGTKHRAVVKTLETSKLEDEPLEPMLYDPVAPERATTLDHLPGSPRITTDGQLRSRPGFAAHVLLCPCVVLAEVVAAIVLAVR